MIKLSQLNENILSEFKIKLQVTAESRYFFGRKKCVQIVNLSVNILSLFFF